MAKATIETAKTSKKRGNPIPRTSFGINDDFEIFYLIDN